MSRITVRLSGPDDVNEPLRFEDFVKQLDSVRQAIRATERVLTGDKTPSIELRVVELSRSSPTQVTVEARQHAKGPDNSDLIINTFFEGVHSLQTRRELPLGFDSSALRAFQAMASMLGKQLYAVDLLKNGDTIALTDALSKNVSALLGQTEYAIGSISGRLEKINLHRDENIFIIYPIVGPAKGVRCRFDHTQEEAAINAVNKYVDVWGRLEYNAIDTFPQQVKVLSIERRELQEPPPKMADMRGISPASIDEKSSEESIGEIRDEW